MDENKALAVLSPEVDSPNPSELSNPVPEGQTLPDGKVSLQAEMIPAIIQQMMGPLVEAMGRMLENNTNALNQLASAQQIQADRLEALEKQIRLNTPVTRQQARYISAAMKEHALELLDKSSVSDDKATRKLVSIIRKDVLSDYGVTVLEEIPKHEYSVAMHRIKTWNNMRMVRDVIREARKREEAAEMALMESAERTACDDGSASVPGADD